MFVARACDTFEKSSRITKGRKEKNEPSKIDKIGTEKSCICFVDRVTISITPYIREVECPRRSRTGSGFRRELVGRGCARRRGGRDGMHSSSSDYSRTHFVHFCTGDTFDESSSGTEIMIFIEES